MADLTGKPISELSEIQIPQDTDLFAVSRSGTSRSVTAGTLLNRILGGYWKFTEAVNRLVSTIADNTTYFAARFYNASDQAIGGLGYRRVSSLNAQGVRLVANRTVNDTTVNNILDLLVDDNGNRVVSFDGYKSAWLTALGFDVESVTATAVSNNNYSTSTINAKKYGKVATVSTTVTVTSPSTSWTDIATGLPTPANMVYLTIPTNDTAWGRPLVTRISASGVLQVARGAAVSTAYNFTLSYITS